MEIFTDFHIHTALSPCGDEDMTPNNIVNMASLKGLDAIAITDHNSCENVSSCIEVGEEMGITVIPGMELQTKEDVHVICLFRNVKDAFNFQNYVYNHLPNLQNKEQIFGKQILYDSSDNIIGYNKKLLLTSTNISFDEAYYMIKEMNGVFIPAHIDKDSFGLISSLGFIPDYLDIKTVEYFSKEKLNKYIKIGIIKDKHKFIKSSDAHYLGDILEKEQSIHVDRLSIDSILDKLI